MRHRVRVAAGFRSGRNDPSLGASWGRPTELPTEGGLVAIRASSALGHGQVQATSNLAACRSFRIAHSVERLCGQPRSIVRIPLKPHLGISCILQLLLHFGLSMCAPTNAIDASHNSAFAQSFNWSFSIEGRIIISKRSGRTRAKSGRMVMALALEINVVLWLIISCATVETVQLVEHLH